MTSRRSGPGGAPWGRTSIIIAVAAVLLAGTLAAVGLLRGGAGDSGFERMKGRWVRPDGGYVLEIRAVDARGTLDAAYLNPRPINVARAQVTRDGSTLKLVVELSAPNYFGSTYTLTYEPARDQLQGIYFQGMTRQTFDVVFVRSQ